MAWKFIITDPSSQSLEGITNLLNNDGFEIVQISILQSGYLYTDPAHFDGILYPKQSGNWFAQVLLVGWKKSDGPCPLKAGLNQQPFVPSSTSLDIDVD